jgi:uncharacterized membrane protein HdeD (DUF308 family)
VPTPRTSFPPHSRDTLREKPTPRDRSRRAARVAGEIARHTACAKNSGGGRMDAASLLVIRGIVGLIFGVVAFAWPGVTIAALVVIFGAYAIIDGVTNLVIGLTRTPTHGRSPATVLQGLVGIAAGVLAFIWPGITALALVFFIGAWAIITGIFEIAAAIRLRKTIKGEWMLALSGLMSLAFGVLVFAFPGAGAVGIAWVLGVYAAAAGIVLIALGIRLRTAMRVIA